jgi:hypothetical protein
MTRPAPEDGWYVKDPDYLFGWRKQIRNLERTLPSAPLASSLFPRAPPPPSDTVTLGGRVLSAPRA